MTRSGVTNTDVYNAVNDLRKELAQSIKDTNDHVDRLESRFDKQAGYMAAIGTIAASVASYVWTRVLK